MAAKRHHASKSARHREHMGMERYERGSVKQHRSGSAGGYHSLGHERYDREPMTDSHHDLAVREHDDRSMISEDHRAIANLPQEVMIKPYPPMAGYMPEGLDDTIRGVDHQMGGDHASAQRGLKPMKY